ncbi:MAG: HAD family hydrolase [Deltaproteobacteria bacterium]|nr:MAG: HAD family hydrolase [Deltaproteobacteria bacterium]
MPAPYRGVLLDLFGTLITFEPGRLPEMQVGSERIRTTVAGLAGPLATWAPGTTPEGFLQALVAVSDEMARGRTSDHVELPSRERFRRALERVGCDDTRLAEAAVHLSRAHMALIATATILPDEHRALLEALRPRYRLGLVSNFDDTATGLGADEVLFVGDTFAEDVLGARAAGVDAAWIDARGGGVPDGATPPRFRLRGLCELAPLLVTP